MIYTFAYYKDGDWHPLINAEDVPVVLYSTVDAVSYAMQMAAITKCNYQVFENTVPFRFVHTSWMKPEESDFLQYYFILSSDKANEIDLRAARLAATVGLDNALDLAKFASNQYSVSVFVYESKSDMLISSVYQPTLR